MIMHGLETNSVAQTIDQIERLQSEDDLDAARKLLRTFLFNQADAAEHGSFGEALAKLAENKTQHSVAAAIVLRFLPVQTLIPESNVANQINRSVVEIVTGSLPELARFLGVTDSVQTFENFDILRGAHQRICALLAPLLHGPTTLELFLGARHEVVQALNHSAVSAYCAPFDLNEIRNSVEQVFASVRKISTTDQAALHHQIKAFRKLSDEFGKTFGARHNFLIKEFFLPFLNAANSTVQRFVAETRGRGTAAIIPRLAGNNSIPKRYPLDRERELAILIPLRNEGPGTALNVQADITYDGEEIVFGPPVTNLGAVPPGDFSVAFDALVIATCEKVGTILTITWEEMGDPERKSLVQEVEILAQRHDVPWNTLIYDHPYNTAVAKGDDFVGRKEKVVSLANKILRTPMEPFYVTGQKRVGKTSLAIAAADFAKAQSPDVDYRYVLWGGVAYENPRDFVRALGKEMADFIGASLPPSNNGQFRFEGSLAPILGLAARAHAANPRRKYVIIIDEFDEIHPELYVQGNLAETFFANLRALATAENICLVLIGGENMPFIMERQGQKLNKFARFGLDYFSRLDEWDDFKLLVRKPSEANLTWHDEAIAEIFNVTNGNPYFAKAVCANVFSCAVRERDADVAANEVQRAVSSETASFDTNHFAHLWQDGIFRSGPDREPYILQRCRVLVAIARTLRRGDAVTLEHLVSNKHSSRLSAPDISAVLNDFMRREILSESEGFYKFVLPVFGLWLKDVGVRRLVSDTLAQELAEAAQIEEDRSYVQSDEVTQLTAEWPTYRGRKIGTDDVRSWFEQVALHKEQRLLFKVLRNLQVFSEIAIREKLKVAHSFIRTKLPEFVIKKRSDRRTDVVVTYVDGEGKSGQFYASRYAEENQLSVRSILSPHKFSSAFEAHRSKYGSVAALLIVDDIVATGDSLAGKLTSFTRENESALRDAALRVTAIALTATADGEARVRDALQEFDWLDFDLRICEPLLDRAFAFHPSNKIWGSQDELEGAKALCRDLGANIYRDAPLGYGDQALLVVFPETCPNNTLPIIHSSSRSDAPRKWRPLFPRITN
jgi:hypothetical protein